MRITESKFIEPDKLTFADAAPGDVFQWKARPALGYHMKCQEAGADLGSVLESIGALISGRAASIRRTKARS